MSKLTYRLGPRCIPFYTTYYVFDSFTEQKKHSFSLGNTSEEVYENLRPLGLVYQTFLDTIETTQVDRIHKALLEIYGATYPLRQIVNDVGIR